MGIAPNRAALSESGDSELKRFKHLRGFLRKHLWRYALGVLCLLAVDVLQLIIPRLLANVTDSLAYGQLTPAGLKRHVFLLLGLASAIAAGRFLWRIFINGAARKADFCLRNKLFAHLEKLPRELFQPPQDRRPYGPRHQRHPSRAPGHGAGPDAVRRRDFHDRSHTLRASQNRPAEARCR